MDYKQLIRFKDGQKKGDITPLFKDETAFSTAVEELVKPFLAERIDKVAGIESRGFILAGAAAYLLKRGMVPIRKGGNLIFDTLMKEVVDYTGTKKVMEIHKDAIRKGDRVLVIDDWLETGSQAEAASQMIEELGGEIVGFAVLVDTATDKAKQFLSKYRYHYLVHIPV